MAFQSDQKLFMFVLLLALKQLVAKPLVPCFFVFGDSFNDNGNNNNITTMAKHDYVTYGIDFPDGPTGRFTNGQNLVDILGFKFTTTACCGPGRNRGQSNCRRNQIPCKNRDEYFFWDPFHPTEAANLVVARKLFGDDAEFFTYPFTISQLARL